MVLTLSCGPHVVVSPHRDALSDLALHFLNKMKIMVVKEIEREDIEFICKVRLERPFSEGSQAF